MNDLGDQQQDDQQDDEQQVGRAEDDTSNPAQQAEQVEQDGQCEGEVIIGFGDESAPSDDDVDPDGKPAAAWIKNLRKESREKDKRIRELEQAAAQAVAANAPKEEDVGREPEMGDDDISFDADVFKEKWTAWNARKVKAEEVAKSKRLEAEAEHTAWQGKVTAYKAAGAALKAAGFEEAESVVLGSLDATQQAILLEGPKTAEASAQLVTALGRNQAKLAELASIKNPVKYAFAVAELVGQLKVQPKKQPPAPESQVRGSAGRGTAIDNQEARLEREADESGDRTKLHQYRRDKQRREAEARAKAA